jgi:hypothetical protein
VMEILRANTEPNEQVSTATILVPVEMVDAQGGFPADYFGSAGTDDASPEQLT